jgi:hypothetical protein
MSLFATARSIYIALKDDESAMAAIATERTALALSLATDANASMRITNATVNGQSFSGSVTMTNQERLRMLGLILKMNETGGVPASESHAIF